ncbi:hypothetical protein GmHk_02G005376 [Glycine max]|nr:hypothetical protein GmHk_02G005376 [Glycine max]
MYNSIITYVGLHCSIHWKMIVILPKKNVVIRFYSLHNRLDNYLKGIINKQKGSIECGYYVMHWMSTIILGSFKNNWETYFNDGRPLEPKRLKVLRMEWATYYLKVKNETISV